jgi:hypothetical protein
MRKEALRLYRHSLKMLRALPPTHSTVFKNKMAYNFREIFTIHRNEQDTEKIAKLIEDGKNDVQVLGDLFSLSPEIVSKLFPLFELPHSHTQEQQQQL